MIVRRLAFRLASGLLVLWGAATLTFLAMHIPKGDPALVILGGETASPTPEVLAQVHAQYGLDLPLWRQYLDYLGRLVQGDLGTSYQLRTPVTSAIGAQLGPTVELAAAGAVTAVVLALVVSLVTARRHSRLLDALAAGTTTVLASMPSFVLGIGLLIVFSFTFHVFPSSGTGGLARLVLPVATVALPVSAHLIQVLRPELDDVLEQPFIVTARARGMRDAAVRVRHALRHAMIPIATLTGFVVAGLIGGAVLTETVFSRQGIGRLAVTAVQSSDLPLVLGVVLLSAAAYVVVNLLVDLLYTVLDPRVVTA